MATKTTTRADERADGEDRGEACAVVASVMSGKPLPSASSITTALNCERPRMAARGDLGEGFPCDLEHRIEAEIDEPRSDGDRLLQS